MHGLRFPLVSVRSPTTMGFNALLVGLWLWLYWPVLDYLAIIFSREDFRTNQIALLLVGLLIARQGWGQGGAFPLGSGPRAAPLPLVLVVGGSLLYLLVERFLDVNTLSALLFGLATYGLLGLWMAPARWRQGLGAALLVIATLPFGEHLQTFVGYPLRIVTAELVRDGLAMAGVGSVGVDTILVFENGVSQVDLPCSGIKSVWAGLIFLLAATWVEARRFDRRWLLTLLLLLGLLFTANLARVAILVILGPVAGWSLVAEMFHIPLGVLGFALACGTALAALRHVGPLAADPHPDADTPPPPAQGHLAPLLAVALLGMCLLYTPRPQTGLQAAPPAWAFPATLAMTPTPLRPDERAWLIRDGAESAERWRFQWGTLTGSMMLVPSTTWRAHHRPERCFEVYGLTLNESRTHLVAAGFPLRLVSLGKAPTPTMVASYWFQSATTTTDDYATRIWADLAPQRSRWVLVSVLFDGRPDPTSAETQALYQALHRAVAMYLQGDESA